RSRRKVRALFGALWSNDDEAAYRMGRAVLAGEHAWMEQGGMGLGLTVEELRPAQPVAARPPPQDEQRPLPPAPTAVPVA
ncbi:MAG TPA: acyl-CoA dehydrogenase, partial [Anaeromyxobacter sp.]